MDKNARRRLMNKTDLIFIAGGFLAALIMLLFMNNGSGDGGMCQIVHNGKVVKTLSLKTDGIFTLERNPNVVFQVKDGAVAFIASDCPDGICVRTGFLRHSMQMAACLPNKVVIKITPVKKSSSPNDIDAISN